MTPMKLVEADGPALGQILDETHGIWSDGLSRVAYERFNEAQSRTPWGRDHLRRYLLMGDDRRVLSSAASVVTRPAARPEKTSVVNPVMSAGLKITTTNLALGQHSRMSRPS